MFYYKKLKIFLAKFAPTCQNEPVRFVINKKAGYKLVPALADIGNGGERMTGGQRCLQHTRTRRHKVIMYVILMIMTCVFLLSSGCNSEKGVFGKGNGSNEVKVTPSEEEKARLFKKIDKKFENPDAHYELGQLYQADGLWMQAQREYNTALSFDPAHRRAQAAMVKVLLSSGDVNKSKLSADIYMNQVSGSAMESLRLALAFQKERFDEYALACYRQALNLAPNSAKITRQIGYYYLSKGNKEMAKEYLTRSFQLDSNQPEVAGQLGRMGVIIKVPRKTESNTKKLDQAVEQSDQQRAP